MSMPLYQLGYHVYVSPIDNGSTYRGEIVGKAVFDFKGPEYLVKYEVRQANYNQRWFIERDVSPAIT